ncbi:MAG: CoA transferase [Thermodesulfobacteriota bacterium]
MAPKALAGIRVLDLTRIFAGPYCSMLFADMGAEVIKIEPPEGEIIRDNPPLVEEGEGGPHDRSRSGYFLTLNRNKYGIITKSMGSLFFHRYDSFAFTKNYYRVFSWFAIYIDRSKHRFSFFHSAE